MIVKFESYRGWEMFDEIDTLSFTRHNHLEPLPHDTLDYIGVVDKSDPIQGYLLTIINKNQLAETYIAAKSPVYILNNEGKTIEKL